MKKDTQQPTKTKVDKHDGGTLTHQRTSKSKIDQPQPPNTPAAKPSRHKADASFDVAAPVRHNPAGAKHKEPYWLQEIHKCQERITMACSDSPLGPDHYYLTAYRDFEISFWMHIPKWILEIKQDKRCNVGRCLDIGSAYGTLALFCKNVFDCDVYVTDFTDAFMRPALFEDVGINFAINNFEFDTFPWNDAMSFDVIILTEVLEHFNLHPFNTLRKIHSLLSEDGYLFLSTPDSAQWGVTTQYYPDLASIPMYGTGDQTPVDDHIWQYSKPELLYVLDEAGFYLERLEYSPGMMGRHFNLCARKRLDSIPQRHRQTAADARLEVLDYLYDSLDAATARLSSLLQHTHTPFKEDDGLAMDPQVLEDTA